MPEATSHTRPIPDRRVGYEPNLSASRVLAEVAMGHETLVVTHGQFSLIDALWALLRTTGPADLSVATWTAAKLDVTRVHQFLTSGEVRALRWLIDRSYRGRHKGYTDVLVDLFGPESIRTMPIHGKFATIRNESWELAVLTSMNLNHNARLETIQVAGDPELVALLDAVFDDAFEHQPPGVMSAPLPKVRPLDSLGARPLPLPLPLLA